MVGTPGGPGPGGLWGSVAAAGTSPRSQVLTVFAGRALPVVAARPERHRTLVRDFRVRLVRDVLPPAPVVRRHHVVVDLLKGWGAEMRGTPLPDGVLGVSCLAGSRVASSWEGLCRARLVTLGRALRTRRARTRRAKAVCVKLHHTAKPALKVLGGGPPCVPRPPRSRHTEPRVTAGASESPAAPRSRVTKHCVQPAHRGRCPQAADSVHTNRETPTPNTDSKRGAEGA